LFFDDEMRRKVRFVYLRNSQFFVDTRDTQDMKKCSIKIYNMASEDGNDGGFLDFSNK